MSYDKDGYALKEGDREQLFRELLEANIPYAIEQGVSLQSCEEVLQLCAEYPGRIFLAIGIHPTRSTFEKRSDWHKLDAYANTPGVIAIGEIGLDYHYKREERHRLKHYIWFLYQLNLAWKLKLPVILHVRDAHEDALRILKWHTARKLGGVIHCFYSSKEIAELYLKLGCHVGIGGSVLQLEERAKDMWEAMPHIPLDRILVETDAPFILPYCKDVIQPKLLHRARNTSQILPAVINKILKLCLDRQELTVFLTEDFSQVLHDRDVSEVGQDEFNCFHSTFLSFNYLELINSAVESGINARNGKVCRRMGESKKKAGFPAFKVLFG